MILDLPPQIEQAIIATAEAQGLTVEELFQQMFSEKEMMLNSDDIAPIELSQDDFQRIFNDESPNVKLQAFMAQYGNLNNAQY